MENKRRGFFTLETVDGPRTAHFSRRFITKLKEVTGLDLVSWGVKIEELKDPVEQFDLISGLWYAGLLANSDRLREEIDFNQEDASDWLWDAVMQKPEVSAELLDALRVSMPTPEGNLKGKKKS